MKNVEDILPLSPMQRLMLMHSLTVAGFCALSNQFIYRITGSLDVDGFSAAWQSLVDRHGALRTGFAWEGVREPVQIVRQTATQPFHYEDLSSLGEPQRLERLGQLQDADRRLGFDLRKAPLSRVTVIRTAQDQHTMLWTRHHLVLDRWCVDILFDELFAFYHAQVNGADAGLAAAGSFRDYVAWLQQQDAALAQQYWQDALAGLQTPSLIVPPDKARGGARDHDLASLDDVVEPALHARIRTLAQNIRISQAALYQGTVALLLARHCAQQEVTFGMTVSGRPADLAGVESTMGSFINNVPVYLRLDVDTALSEWLRSLHAAQAARFRYEYVSPVDLHRWSGLAANTPLFDVLLLMHSPATEVRAQSGIRIEQVEGPLDSAFPLTLSLADNDGRLEMTAVFDTRRVGPDTARDLLAGLKTILARMVEDPDAALGTFLPFLRDECGISADKQPGTASAPAAQDHAERLQQLDPQAALSEIWRNTLGLERVGLDDDFFALGGTSIQAALLFAQIEQRFGRVLSLSTLFTAGSVREFLALLDKPMPRTSPLVSIQPQGKRAPFYVVPGIGGNVVGLAGLARALGPDQPLYGLQSVGLDGQEEPAARIEEIAARYLQELAGAETPLVLFGICWGAAVAFEMAQQMTASGQAPALLIVMDPTHHEPLPGAKAGPRAPRKRSRHLLRYVLGRLRLYLREFRALSGAARRAWLKEKRKLVLDIIRQRDPFRGDHTEFHQRRVVEANAAALKHYRPTAYPGETLVLFTGERQVDPAVDPRRRWLQFVPAGSPLLQVAGRDTGDALSPRHVATLAVSLCSAVDRRIDN